MLFPPYQVGAVLSVLLSVTVAARSNAKPLSTNHAPLRPRGLPDEHLNKGLGSGEGSSAAHRMLIDAREEIPALDRWDKEGRKTRALTPADVKKMSDHHAKDLLLWSRQRHFNEQVRMDRHKQGAKASHGLDVEAEVARRLKMLHENPTMRKTWIGLPSQMGTRKLSFKEEVAVSQWHAGHVEREKAAQTQHMVEEEMGRRGMRIPTERPTAPYDHPGAIHTHTAFWSPPPAPQPKPQVTIQRNKLSRSSSAPN